MQFSPVRIIGSITFLAVLAGCAQQSAEPATHSDLSDWNQTGNANWRMEDNVIIADQGTGMLVTPQSYTDVHVQLEFWVDREANSGVFLRVQDPSDVNDRNAYEVNIFDSRPDQTYRTGGVVHFAAPNEVIHTSGRWNTYDIRQEGDRLQVKLNGIEMVDIEDDTFDSGPVGLQYGAGEVRFRHVNIRAL